MHSGRTNNFPESGRGLGHVTPTIFGSTVGYPSDSLASCQNSFTVRRKFVITLSLKIPAHLKCVATLPCGMSESHGFGWRVKND